MNHNQHFYNEINQYRAAVLRERMEDGYLPKGTIDERNIEIIPDEDFLGYTQIHLFAGIGGFPLGLRRADFPENIRIITGGFPCQDISNAGKRAGITGSRSRLWREMVRCIRVVRPDYVFVENVAALLNRGMGVVLGDLADIGYDAIGDCISAADVGASHLRRRIWIVAYATGSRCERRTWQEQSVFGRSLLSARLSGCSEMVADSQEFCEELRKTKRERQRGFASSGEDVPDAHEQGLPIWSVTGTHEENAENKQTRIGSSESCEIPHAQDDTANGKRVRRGNSTRQWWIEPDVGRVAHGIPKRVDRLAALGDAIVPQCVEEVIHRFFS